MLFDLKILLQRFCKKNKIDSQAKIGSQKISNLSLTPPSFSIQTQKFLPIFFVLKLKRLII